MRARLDLLGQSFGRLTVVAAAETTLRGRTRWTCACACGGQAVSETHNLRGGRSVSCGCINRERLAVQNRARAPHGLNNTPAHKSWKAMIGRCECSGNASYPRYGALGVTVCRRWRESFAAFYEDMGPRPEGMTLDRIDNERGYEPGNCRWATPSEQAFNRRPRLQREAAEAPP